MVGRAQKWGHFFKKLREWMVAAAVKLISSYWRRSVRAVRPGEKSPEKPSKKIWSNRAIHIAVCIIYTKVATFFQ